MVQRDSLKAGSTDEPQPLSDTQRLSAESPPDRVSAIPESSLLKIHHQTSSRLDFSVGGMSKEQFASLPVVDQRLVYAAHLERVIIALTLNPKFVDHALVQKMSARMASFAAEQSFSKAAPQYTEELAEVGPKLETLLENRPSVLEVGNMPGKIDRVSIPSVSEYYHQALGLIYSLFPNSHSCQLFRMAVEECLNNHATHGSGNDPRKRIRIRATARQNSVGIAVQDEGWGYRPKLIADPTKGDGLYKVTGRGLMFMNTFADRCYISQDGRLSAMIKRWSED